MEITETLTVDPNETPVSRALAARKMREDLNLQTKSVTSRFRFDLCSALTKKLRAVGFIVAPFQGSTIVTFSAGHAFDFCATLSERNIFTLSRKFGIEESFTDVCNFSGITELGQNALVNTAVNELACG